MKPKAEFTAKDSSWAQKRAREIVEAWAVGRNWLMDRDRARETLIDAIATAISSQAIGERSELSDDSIERAAEEMCEKGSRGDPYEDGSYLNGFGDGARWAAGQLNKKT